MFTPTIATPHNAFTIIFDDIHVNLHVNLNFNYPIGPCRNTLKPYNHVACVTEMSVWIKCSTTVQRLDCYHKQGHRVARANKSMSSSRKKTPPRSSNRKVQKHLDQITKTAYHQRRAIHRVHLAKESGQTPTSDCVGYLRDLSKGSRADQKSYSVLKDRVRENAAELFGHLNSLFSSCGNTLKATNTKSSSYIQPKGLLPIQSRTPFSTSFW